MTKPIEVPRGEHGLIRVFAVNRPKAEMLAELKSRPKPDLARELLGLPHLDTSSTEIFAVSDLSGVGLANYLSEGYAVPEAETGRDKARLDALDGYVLLLFSDSFGGREATLEPGPDVTLIGTYGEFTPAPATETLSAESAQAYTGVRLPPKPTLQRRRPGSGAVVVLALLVLAALLWWGLALR